MVIFPDIERILVSFFNDAFATIGNPLTDNVLVATKHSQPDETTPSKQLVITGAYNNETDARVTKNASVMLEVYADTYGEATDLALLVDALVRHCTIDGIKRAEVRMGPTRIAEDTTQEKRYIDVGLVVKGSEI